MPQSSRQIMILAALLVLVVAVSVCAAGTPQVVEKAAIEPRIVHMPQMVLTGVVDSAPDVSELDIAAMWDRFTAVSDQLKNVVEGIWYEFHAQTEGDSGVHLCLVGVEVTDIADTPVELFTKVLPPCTYAVFTHRVTDGYAHIYSEIGAWLESSEYTEAYPYDFQLYDSRFKAMDDPESEQDIYVPVRIE